MCGIVVTVGYNTDDINTMLDEIRHRGIDNRGIKEYTYDGKSVILGHNRLSINDVSPLGNQPMLYDDIALVVNGEIWNYPTLRKEYEERGYSFKSHSDSEIILYLYKEKELHRLDGMFSFVIYDKDKLVVSRDWVGKVPLYIHNTDKIIIASELKAINKFTKTKDINFVPKNSLVEINLSNKKTTVVNDFYFKFSNEVSELTDTNLIGKKTFELMDNAVKKRLLSDVPIATSLSGGIDSSIITYLLAQSIPNLRAYTIKFDEESDDLHYARIVANHLGVNLIEVEIPKNPELIKQRFLESIWVIEYPLAVQSQVGILQSFIAEQMAKDGIKVAFSGEGADEAYGSYGMLRRFSKKPDWSDVRKELFEKQHYGNLLRGNTIFMYYGTIELRCPFFDTDFLNFTTNLPNTLHIKRDQYKLPLAEAFRGKLPDAVLDQPKRAFQRGTNFKGYIEELILSDSVINFNNRTTFTHVVYDNFEKINNFSHKRLKHTIDNTTKNIYAWL